jgi:hypothetical protein
LEPQIGLLVPLVKVTKFSISTSAGVIFSIILFVWIGNLYFDYKKNERLPLRIQKDLIKLKKQLPIKLSPEASLENFELKRNSVSIYLRIIKNLNSDLPKYEIESRVNFLICKLRQNSFDNDPMTFNIKIIDSYDTEIASVRNTLETCSVPLRQFEGTL